MTKEKFEPWNVEACIEQWLEFGEEMRKRGAQGGYFSGAGWAARCLRAHLEELRATNAKRSAGSSDNATSK